MRDPDATEQHDIPRMLGMPFAQGITLLYAFLSGVWIYFSDRLIVLIANTPGQLLFLSTGKGWFFICVTALLLFFTLHRFTAQVRRNHQRIRSDSERYRITLQAIGDGVIVTDAKGRVEMINPVAETLTGWTEKNAHGKSLQEVFQIVNEQTRQKVEDPAAKVLNKGTIVGLANHTLLLAKDGIERPIADSGAPIRNDYGKITGVVIVFRDQTEDRLAQLKQQQHEDFLKDIMYSIQDGICVLNPDLTIRYTNPVMKTWYGDRQPLRGQKCHHCYHLSSNPCTPCPALRSLQSKKMETEVVPGPAESQLEWLDLCCYPMLDSQTGEITGIIEYIRDISERVRLEDQLRQAQKMESIGRLAGGIAHDYNNMLGVIMGHTELAMEKVQKDDILQTHLSEIFQATQRSRNITRQLLTFARKQTIAPQILDFNATVSAALEMLRRLIGEDIDIDLRTASEALSVKMDPTQVDQILANLCVNAKDAIDGNGKIIIETSSMHFDESYCAAHPGFLPGDYVRLAVSDDGYGMDKQTQDKLFEPFFTTKEVGKGTGLGLATVYGIVKQNNGLIQVYSEPRQGTTFNIYLPHSMELAAETSPQPSPQLPKSQGETIIVVEDEEAVLHLSCKILEKLGYTVETATTPSEALALAASQSKTIDLLITDVVMPQMNGQELAQQLVARSPHMKVLFMSGYTANVITDHGISEKGMHFLQKPFSQQDMATKVREALSDRSPLRAP